MAKNSKVLIYILSAIIVIQSAVIVYLLIDKQKIETKVEVNRDKIIEDSLLIVARTEEFKLVGEDLKRLKAEMAEMGLQNDSASADLDELLEALWNVEMGGALDIDALNNKIARAKNLLVVKDLQLKQLRDQSDSLSYEAKTLKEEKIAQQEQVEEMLKDNRKLSANLKIASRVKIENILILGLTKKKKVLNKEPYKSKDLSEVKISFNLAENRFIKLNTPIEFYFRLMNKEKVFNDSGEERDFQTLKGEKLIYTDKQSVIFDNTQQVLNYSYNISKPLAAGSYKLELYADGYPIGDGKFDVK